MKNKQLWVLTEVVCLFPILVGIYLSNQLPDRIASHWSLSGQVNGTLPKWVFVFLLPTFAAVLQGILFSKIQEIKTIGFRLWLTWLLPVCSLIFQLSMIQYSQNSRIDMRQVALLFAGVVFLVIGNYLPKKINAQGGIRRQGRRFSPKIARRLAYLFVGEGLLLIGLLWLQPTVSLLSIGLFVIGICFILWKQ